MGEAPNRVAVRDAAPHGSGIRNPVGSIAVVGIAFAPQLAALAYGLVRICLSIFSFLPGSEAIVARSPMALGIEIITHAIADRNLLAVYSLPLIAIAIVTLFVKIKASQDYYGGVVVIAIALFAFWASSDLAGQRGFSFGPGTAPRLFAGLLFLLGAGVSFTGLMKEGDPLQRFAVRGPFFVTLSILLFSVAIRPLGLILSGILTFLVAAMGSAETRWVEAVIVGVLLTAFCAFLFPVVLGLPFQLWPQFLQ